MAKPTTARKSKSSTAKKDAELRKLLDKPDFRSFDKAMQRLLRVKKDEIEIAPSKRER